MNAREWLLILSILSIAFSVAVIAIADAQQYPAIPVQMWSVNHETYTALFIREDYVVVFTAHGDIDLGYRYISVYPGSTAYVYRINGSLVTTLSAGTYRIVESGGSIQFVKLKYPGGTTNYDRSGFFSGNGEWLVENPQYYGTEARVALLGGDTEILGFRTIDFNNTAGTFYPVQIDYHGRYIAIGERPSGRVLLYKYCAKPGGGDYDIIWNSTVIGDIRRIAMTLDAKYLVYGALSHPYLYIAERDENDAVSVIAQIPLEGGVGALTITDLWNIGYILVGTDNGHIYIFDVKYKGTPSDPYLVKHISNATYPEGTGTTGRFYNPFYNRYSPPENIRLVAFSTNTNPYVSIIVDIHNKTFWRYTGSGLGRATAISLEGNYLFAGRSLFTTVNPDVQSGNPRVRFSGTTYFNYGEKPYELSQPIVIDADSKDYHVYFTSGQVKLTGILSISRPVTLITDQTIKEGKLGTM